MTTDLLARLTAAITIEDPAVHQLITLLDDTIEGLRGLAHDFETAADQRTAALPKDVDPDDDPTVRYQRGRADDCDRAALDLDDWATTLKDTLAYPPDQREAIG